MIPTQPATTDVAILPASTRTGSLNGALAVELQRRLGDRAAIVDLDAYEMPIYHGDVEAASGVPPAAVELARRLGAAPTVVIVSPEYNGSFPPLLKNAIDWASRADRSMLADTRVLLAAATPGRSGGREVLAMLRMWMQHMRVDLADRDLGVGGAELVGDRIAGVDAEELDAFVDQIPSRDRSVDEAPVGAR